MNTILWCQGDWAVSDVARWVLIGRQLRLTTFAVAFVYVAFFSFKATAETRCQTDDFCAGLYRCNTNRGVCLEACTKDGDCKEGAKCSSQSNKVSGNCYVVQCTSPDDGRCRGYKCDVEHGKCLNKCSDSNHCRAGNMCMAGRCIKPGCTDDSDCINEREGFKCLGGRCGPSCTNNSQCQKDYQCLSGQCISATCPLASKTAWVVLQGRHLYSSPGTAYFADEAKQIKVPLPVMIPLPVKGFSCVPGGNSDYPCFPGVDPEGNDTCVSPTTGKQCYGWYQIEYGNQVGWIQAPLVTVWNSRLGLLPWEGEGNIQAPGVNVYCSREDFEGAARGQSGYGSCFSYDPAIGNKTNASKGYMPLPVLDITQVRGTRGDISLYHTLMPLLQSSVATFRDDKEKIVSSIGRLEFVFLVDATASMGPAIDAVVAALDSIISHIETYGTRIEPKFMIIVYRDNPAGGKAWNHNNKDPRLIETTQDSNKPAFVSAQRAKEWLKHVQAGGGGDLRGEAVWDGLAVLADVPRQASVTRLITIIGDAPGHGTTIGVNDSAPYVEVCTDSKMGLRRQCQSDPFVRVAKGISGLDVIKLVTQGRVADTKMLAVFYDYGYMGDDKLKDAAEKISDQRLRDAIGKNRESWAGTINDFDTGFKFMESQTPSVRYGTRAAAEAAGESAETSVEDQVIKALSREIDHAIATVKSVSSNSNTYYEGSAGRLPVVWNGSDPRGFAGYLAEVLMNQDSKTYTGFIIRDFWFSRPSNWNEQLLLTLDERKAMVDVYMLYAGEIDRKPSICREGVFANNLWDDAMRPLMGITGGAGHKCFQPSLWALWRERGRQDSGIRIGDSPASITSLSDEQCKSLGNSLRKGANSINAINPAPGNPFVWVPMSLFR